MSTDTDTDTNDEAQSFEQVDGSEDPSPESERSSDEVADEFRAITDSLPTPIAEINDYDIECEGFSTEPFVGHSVTANLVTRSGPLSRQLQDAASEIGIPFEAQEYVIIEVGDVDWSSTNRVRLRRETFEAIGQWYAETVLDTRENDE